MSDPVLKVVEDLQSDEELTSLSEVEISYSVVLRILDELNWDTHNRREVKVQHSVEKKSVNLTLLPDKPTVFIEVKKGDEPLERHQEQLLGYTFGQDVKIAVLTNGATWWFYHCRCQPRLDIRLGSTYQRGNVVVLPAASEGKVGGEKFDTVELDKQAKEEIAQKLVDFLGKENVSSGKAVQNAEILYEKHQIAASLPEAWNQLVNEPNDLLVELLAEETAELCGRKPDEKEVKQFLLTHLQEMEVTSSPTPSGSMRGKKPAAFTFNGTRYEVEHWNRMLVKLCGIVYNEQGSRFEEVLRFKDFSRKEDVFIIARQIGETGIFVNTCKTADSIIQTAKDLIAHFGYDKNALHIEVR